VLLTGQTGTHRSDRYGTAPASSWFLGLGFVDQPRNPVIFW
jgi:hypothetical protein